MTSLSEADGRRLLLERFQASGLNIKADCMLTVGGHVLEIDGWDGNARIGYEFLSLNDHKRAQYTRAAMSALEQAIGNGELAIFVVDVETVTSRDHLNFAVDAFLKAARTLVVQP
jgi:hypothetical protein